MSLKNTFVIVYGAMIIGLVVVTAWAAFDIHERLPVVLIAQGPVLIMRVFWKRALRRVRR